VSGNVVVSNSLPGSSIVSSSISGDRISTNTIEGTNIAGDTITGNKIAANTIAGDRILANTITATNIQSATITGNLIAANTITGTNIVGNTITGNLIAANTITGNSIVANSITSTQISSAYIYSGNIVSFGASIGNTSSPGYWLQYNTGNARFGGNVSIGSNLTVAGLITTGNLIANTVNTTQVIPAAISSGVGNSSTTTQTFSSPTQVTYYPINTTANIIPTINNQTVYVWAQADVTLDVSNFANQTYVATATAKLVRTTSGNVATVISTQSVSFNGLGGGSPYQPYPLLRNTFVWGGFTDIISTIVLCTYSMEVQYAISGGPTVTDIIVGDRNILLQTLKR
jgi:hypothetical protein